MYIVTAFAWTSKNGEETLHKFLDKKFAKNLGGVRDLLVESFGNFICGFEIPEKLLRRKVRDEGILLDKILAIPLSGTELALDGFVIQEICGVGWMYFKVFGIGDC